jgi:hypothetical protein
MKQQTFRSFIVAVCMAFLLSLGVGCQSSTPLHRESLPSPPKPPRPVVGTVRVDRFACDDEVTAQAANDVFVETLSKNRRIKLVRNEPAEVVIQGTITQSRGGSSIARLGGGQNWVAGKGQAVEGDYVSGMTAMAYWNGDVIASCSWGQSMGKGKELLPPQYVAREAAHCLVSSMEHKFLSARFGDIVWLGIDYSISTYVPAKDPAEALAAFPSLPQAWNDLFLTEMAPLIERNCRKMRTDLAVTSTRNSAVTTSQVQPAQLRPEGISKVSKLKSPDVAQIVAAYKGENKVGTGLVFIMDTLSEPDGMASLHVVFFDLATKEISYCERFCERAGGIGFRNRWFRPVKSAVERLIAD